MITINQFKELFPHSHFKNAELNEHFNGLTAGMFQYEIIGMDRECMFLAQCAHESMGFARIEENLNYSEAGLLRTFPRYFKSEEEAKKYANNPELIANKLYANRMGNCNEASGDGWLHRGMGVLQITGADNQNEFIHKEPRLMGKTFDKDANILLTPYWSAYSAAWFWHKINGNGLADKDDLMGITARINGTTDPIRSNLRCREDWLKKIKKVLFSED
jgi:putative chitinase